MEQMPEKQKEWNEYKTHSVHRIELALIIFATSLSCLDSLTLPSYPSLLSLSLSLPLSLSLSLYVCLSVSLSLFSPSLSLSFSSICIIFSNIFLKNIFSSLQYDFCYVWVFCLSSSSFLSLYSYSPSLYHLHFFFLSFYSFWMHERHFTSCRLQQTPIAAAT